MELNQVKVRRGNVVLSVPEIDKASYLAKGYDILDGFGNVVEESVPNDVPTLQAKFKELSEENAKLKARINELNAKKATTPKKTEEAKPAKTTKAKKESK